MQLMIINATTVDAVQKENGIDVIFPHQGSYNNVARQQKTLNLLSHPNRKLARRKRQVRWIYFLLLLFAFPRPFPALVFRAPRFMGVPLANNVFRTTSPSFSSPSDIFVSSNGDDWS